MSYIKTAETFSIKFDHDEILNMILNYVVFLAQL